MATISETYTPAQGATDWLKGLVGTLVDTGSKIAIAKVAGDSAAKVVATQAEQSRASALATAEQAKATVSASDASGQKWMLIGAGVLVAGVAAIVLIRSVK